MDLVFMGKDKDELSASPATGITPGDEVRITIAGDKFPAQTEFTLVGDPGTQKLGIHTSCSKPLSVGDYFGSMHLIELTSTEGGTASLPGNDVAEGTTCLAPESDPGTRCDSRPVEVVFEYLGDECANPLSNSQEGKATCNGAIGGVDPVNIAYTGKDQNKITVSPASGVKVGDLVRVTASGRKELHADTKLQVRDTGVLQEVKIHTSCSKPLYLGDVFGAFKVVEFTDRKGKVVALPDSSDPGELFTNECELPLEVATPHCRGKVQVLSLNYVGGTCGDTSQDQEGKFECVGDSSGLDLVRIVAYKGGDIFLDTGAPASVMPGHVVNIVADASDHDGHDHEPKLGAETFVDIYDENDALVQSMNIHTSCSKPLNLGDRFGGVEVFSMDTTKQGHIGLGGVIEYQYTITKPGAGVLSNVFVEDDKLGKIASDLSVDPGKTITLFKTAVLTETTTNVVTVTGDANGASCEGEADATVTVEPPTASVDSCADAKPHTLVFTYTGEDCTATTNEQEDKFICNDVPPLPGGPVEVVYIGKDANQIEIVEKGETIPVGGQVTINAFDRDRLHAESMMEIRQGGNVIQYLNVHTSCSKSLVVGDQFGSFVLTEFNP
jgi:hypothetical protein